MNRRWKKAIKSLAGSLLMCGLIFVNPAIAADLSPGRTTILVGFAPGGINDIVSRLFADGLTTRLGQPVIVENKPGANGEIALNEVARAQPDGHTLVSTTSALAATPLLSTTFKYDVVDGYTHLGIIAQTPFLLAASGAMPFNDMAGLIAYGKANPGKLNFGSVTESVNLDFALLWQRIGITVASIPYKGTAPVTAALLANEVQLAGVSHRAVSSHLEAGKLKAIGFASDRRFTLVPQIPALSESVPGYSATTIWIGFSGPKGMPRDVVTRLNKEINGILSQLSIRSQIVDKFSFEIVGSTPEQMTAELRSSRDRYIEAIKLTGFKPQ